MLDAGWRILDSDPGWQRGTGAEGQRSARHLRYRYRDRYRYRTAAVDTDPEIWKGKTARHRFLLDVNVAARCHPERSPPWGAVEGSMAHQRRPKAADPSTPRRRRFAQDDILNDSADPVAVTVSEGRKGERGNKPPHCRGARGRRGRGALGIFAIAIGIAIAIERLRWIPIPKGRKGERERETVPEAIHVIRSGCPLLLCLCPSAPLPLCSSAPLLLCSSAPLLLCSSAPLLPFDSSAHFSEELQAQLDDSFRLLDDDGVAGAGNDLETGAGNRIGKTAYSID